MEFKGSLGNYKVIKTDDQTNTLWSEHFNELFHSPSGAYEETLHNYVLACELPRQIASTAPIHILDVGFGMGIGLLASMDLLHATLDETTSRPLTYTSIELDETLVLWAIANTFPTLHMHKHERNETCVYQGEANIKGSILKITIYIGDGRKTLSACSKDLPSFTAIYQDVFVPKKNPGLWTTEWFSFLKDHSDKEVRFSSYSSSISIRKSLISAGWIIESAKGFAHKKTMTKACLQGEMDLSLTTRLDKAPMPELRDSLLIT